MARERKRADDTSIALFLDMLAAERGAGANTLAAYRNDLDDLAAHLSARGARFAKASTDDLRDYLAALKERGFKAASVARKLSATRQLFRLLYAECKPRVAPSAVLQGPNRARPLPKLLSVDEVDRLLYEARKAIGDATRPLGE